MFTKIKETISALKKLRNPSVVDHGVMPLLELTGEEEDRFCEIGDKQVSELTIKEWDEYNALRLRQLKLLMR